MAYDEDLADRFRSALDGHEGISEKRMMGGVCFMHNGNMIGGASRKKDGERLFMFRVGKDNEAEALSRDGAVIVELGGRRKGGMIWVDEGACGEGAMTGWIALALGFVATLPAK